MRESSAGAGHIRESTRGAVTSFSETDSPAHQRISVPAHGALTVGTLGNIIRAVAAHKGISREELLKSILY